MIEPLHAAALARQLRQDPPPVDMRTGKPDALVRIAIESRSSSLVLPNGNVVDDGESVIAVYESQVEAVLALVEDASAEDLRRVEEDLAYHVGAAKVSDDHGRHWHPSWSGSFRHTMKRDARPLIAAKVLGELETAPASSSKSGKRRGRPPKSASSAPDEGGAPSTTGAPDEGGA